MSRSVFSSSSAAPKLDREPEKRKKQPPVQRAGEGRHFDFNGAIAALSLIIASVAVFLMLSGIMYMNTKINSNKREISRLSVSVDEIQAENVRLNAEFASMVSADKIRNYAVTVLGMQKVERYQVHYFENRAGSSVVVADGKEVVDAVS